jgi:hypothetical protein
MTVNTEYMTKLTREINRLGTPAKLTTTDTTDGPTFLVEVGATWHSGTTEVHEVLISGDKSAVPGDPGSLVFGVYDQDWRAQYRDTTKAPWNRPESLACCVVDFHNLMITAGVYA